MIINDKHHNRNQSAARYAPQAASSVIITLVARGSAFGWQAALTMLLRAAMHWRHD